MTDSQFKYWEHLVCKFFRFSSFNQDVFENLRLHLSSPVLFNDPFEGMNDDMPFIQHDSLVTCFTGLKREDGSSANTLFNPLMWSHYADSHKGFCIVFDPLIAGLFPVKYVKIRPDKFDSHKTLTSKGEVWEYENEYRFIGAKSPSDVGRVEYANGEFFLKFYPDDIKGIVIGCRASESDISRLMNYLIAFANNNDTGDRRVKSFTIKRLRLKKKEFELEAADTFYLYYRTESDGKRAGRWLMLPDPIGSSDEEGSVNDILRNAGLNAPASRPETPDLMKYE